MTVTVTAAISATATTPPMIAPVLSVLVSVLSAWQTSEAGFESKGGSYHNSDCSGF